MMVVINSHAFKHAKGYSQKPKDDWWKQKGNVLLQASMPD